MKKKQKFHPVFIIAFVLIVLSFFFLLFSLFIFCVPGRIFRNSSNIYRLQQFNILSNETTKSLVQISRNLEIGDHISFTNQNGKYLVITSLNDDLESNYRCFGSCYCSSSDTDSLNINSNTEMFFGDSTEQLERRSTSILSKSVGVMLSALSTIMAIQIAKSYFSDQCFQKFSTSSSDFEENGNSDDTKIPKTYPNEYYGDGDEFREFCEKSEVSSEFEGCEVIIEKSLQDEINEIIQHEEDNYEVRNYRCHGKCVMNGGLKVDETKFAAMKFDCGNKEISGDVTVVSEKTNKKVLYSKATSKFRVEYLTTFCREVSFFSYFVETNNQNKLGKYYKQVRKKSVNLCTGSTHVGGFLNKNVQCELLFPEKGY